MSKKRAKSKSRPKSLTDRKNALLGLAMIKLSIDRAETAEQRLGFETVYRMLLGDLKKTDADVDSYIETHREEVEAAIAKKESQANG